MVYEIDYKIEYETDKDSGRVVATIPELNHVSSLGDTFAEAEAHVREAVLGYIEVLVSESKEISKSAFCLET
jgi:predicted RNase H-like HicB family nuclease